MEQGPGDKMEAERKPSVLMYWPRRGGFMYCVLSIKQENTLAPAAAALSRMPKHYVKFAKENAYNM